MSYTSYKKYAKYRINTYIKKITQHTLMDKEATNNFFILLTYIQANTNLLRIFSRQNGPIWQDICVFIRVLRNLSIYHKIWKRPIYYFKINTQNRRGIIHLLIKYLLSQYNTPLFMDSVWYSEISKEILKQQKIFLQIGSGNKFRNLNIPIKLTQKMEHYFLHSPDHLNMNIAIRYAQIRGLGGDKELANIIAGSRLGNDFSNDDFWRSVIIFFINSEIEKKWIIPIINFIQNIKFNKNNNQLKPLFPGFSMKGRKPSSIFKLMNSIDKSIIEREMKSKYKWEKSDITDLYFSAGKNNDGIQKKYYRIYELLTSYDLKKEGSIMRHCAGTYDSACFYGRTSIWSLELIGSESNKKLATIEINPKNRTIYQIKGKCNQKPSKHTMELLQGWIKTENLRLE